MKSSTGFIVFMVLTLGVVGLTVLAESSSSSPSTDSPTAQTKQINDQSNGKTFTADMVAQHNTSNDCWTIIQDKVYDITEYVPRHPGGSEILRACGNDATSLFTQRKTEGGQKVGTGTAHSSSAESILLRYYIGDLAA